MSSKDALTSNISPGRKWLVTLCCTGAFFILAGSILPRMISLPALPEPADNAKAVASGDGKQSAGDQPASTASATAISDRLEPVVIGLCVVTLAAMGLVWFVRRRRVQQAVVLPKIMHMTAALPLRFNCSAYLVEIGGRNLLVGVDPMGIKTVIPLPSEIPETPANEPSPPAISVGQNLRLVSEGATG